ncbi:hypothetical protein [Vibrio parahaemolyticus]|uniref:hypothetical protein n=1 Tax=Vibrio parahaemolyticus TaxID=670 RepID=UPI00209BCD01|nr:hypothetical protein [Vibrio parahaemolyticus]
MVKAVGMIFNTEMAQMLYLNEKSVTRRPIKFPDGWELKDTNLSVITSAHPKKDKWGAIVQKGVSTQFPQSDLIPAPCAPGDYIWVRETFCMGRVLDHDSGHPASDYLYVEQCEDKSNYTVSKAHCSLDRVQVDDVVWTPSIHMPRKASRITLKVTDVRIETLSELRNDEDQLRKEGFANWPQFKHTWQSIYGLSKPSDYVWVIEFDIVYKNIEELMPHLFDEKAVEKSSLKWKQFTKEEHGEELSDTDQIIKQLFAERWTDDLRHAPLEKLRQQVYKNLKDQMAGYWSGHTAYHLLVDGGFLIDAKFEQGKGKKLTLLGRRFIENMESRK